MQVTEVACIFFVPNFIRQLIQLNLIDENGHCTSSYKNGFIYFNPSQTFPLSASNFPLEGYQFSGGSSELWMAQMKYFDRSAKEPV